MTPLQEELLKLWKQLKIVLDEHQITYWAIGGTAIGALREKGFVPWDDDLDICVLEEDIPKLLQAVKDKGMTTKSPYLKFNPYPFFKVFSQTKITSFGEKDKLYIDIFPGQLERKWNAWSWHWFRMRDGLLYAKSKLWKNWLTGSQGFGIYFGLLIAKWLTFWLPTKWLVKRQWKMISSPRIVDNANYNIRYSYFLDRDKPFNISEIKEIPFEDTSIKVNKSFAHDMQNVFGDIMQRPSDKKRINHNIKLR